MKTTSPISNLDFFFNLCKKNLTVNTDPYIFLQMRDLFGWQAYGYCSKEIFDYSWLTSKGVNLEEYNDLIIKTGFNRVANHFQDRIIFEIKDEFNETVALGGRAIFKGMVPKYRNTSYNKKDYLFGLNISKKLILEQKYCVVVEGYVDCIRLLKNNIPSVALLGLGCSHQQFCKLLRYTSNVFICLDGDSPGKAAAESLYNTYSDYDCELTKITLPDKLDPDEYVIGYGEKEFRRLLK